MRRATSTPRRSASIPRSARSAPRTSTSAASASTTSSTRCSTAGSTPRSWRRISSATSPIARSSMRPSTAAATPPPGSGIRRRACSPRCYDGAGRRRAMIRILTYNVHSCRGLDGRVSPGRIAEVIAAARADIVALQELDVGRARSGGLDQAQAIARELGIDVHFHPARQVEGERYGDAILSALPFRLVKAGPLPEPPRRPPFFETRGALWVSVELAGGAGEL